MARHVKTALIAAVASAMYFALAYITVGSFFARAPGLEWSTGTFGVLAGSRIWSHSAHSVALLVAATPSALVSGIFGRPHALRLAATTGLVAAAAFCIPSFQHPQPSLDTDFYVTAGIDGLKMMLILILLTWLVGKLASRNASAPPDGPSLTRAAAQRGR